MATRIPFTESQWEELENQALVFKYLAAGVPVPSHLLFQIRKPFLLSSTPLSSHFGWNVYEMGTGRKVDAEPGRCKRTDGKKWRCSKEAYPDSKYCQRHMHRGKNRSSTKPLPPPPPASHQFSDSSTPSLFPDSSSRVRRRRATEDDDSSCGYQSLKETHNNSSSIREKHCCILGTDLGRPLMQLKEREDYGEEEEQRSKRVYRFLDECPSSSTSSVSTSLFIGPSVSF